MADQSGWRASHSQGPALTVGPPTVMSSCRGHPFCHGARGVTRSSSAPGPRATCTRVERIDGGSDGMLRAFAAHASTCAHVWPCWAKALVVVSMLAWIITPILFSPFPRWNLIGQARRRHSPAARSKRKGMQAGGGGQGEWSPSVDAILEAAQFWPFRTCSRYSLESLCRCCAAVGREVASHIVRGVGVVSASQAGATNSVQTIPLLCLITVAPRRPKADCGVMV